MRSYEETARRLFERREVYAVQRAVRRKRARRTAAILSAAACLCIVMGVTLHTLIRLDYFAASCGSSPGFITEEGYFYLAPHEGVCRYDPETGVTERRLSQYWFDSCIVNDYGIYYWRGRALWVLPHGTEERQRLYTAPRSESTHISCELMTDGHVAVTLYDKHEMMMSQVKVHGISGEVLEVLTPRVSYRTPLHTDLQVTVGERHLTLEPVDAYESVFVIKENGVPLLPEGQYVGKYPTRAGDAVVFGVWDTSKALEGDTTRENWVWYYYVFRPDGDDSAVGRTAYPSYFGGGNGDYLFYVQNETIYCVDAHTDEHWALTLPVDLPDTVDIYDVSTDGFDLYTSAPWSETQAYFKVVYENGIPTALILIDENISE